VTTAHIFVQEAVAYRGPLEATDLETKCSIAVMDILPDLTGEDARKAVLAVHAMMAWEAAPLQSGDVRAIKLDNSGQPIGPSVVIRATPPAGTEIAAENQPKE